MTMTKKEEEFSHSWLSLVLVSTQFLLIAFLMFFGPLWPTHWGLRGMIVCSGVMAIWAFLAMGFGNIRAFPEIPEHGRLVVHGPYQWVRHPMYTSLLLLTLAWMMDQPFPIRMVLWVGLVVTLWIKLGYEEKLLLARFPSYGKYRMRTKRLIPFLF